MNTLIRRLFLVGAAAAACGVGWTAWLRRRRPDSQPAAAAPLGGRVPFAFTELVDDLAPADAPPTSVPPAPDLPAWVAPVDGECPDGYPIKANANSGIFHMPGGRFYERTVPERCYADPADAEADGYRRAKA